MCRSHSNQYFPNEECSHLANPVCHFCWWPAVSTKTRSSRSQLSVMGPSRRQRSFNFSWTIFSCAFFFYHVALYRSLLGCRTVRCNSRHAFKSLRPPLWFNDGGKLPVFCLSPTCTALKQRRLKHYYFITSSDMRNSCNSLLRDLSCREYVSYGLILYVSMSTRPAMDDPLRAVGVFCWDMAAGRATNSTVLKQRP